MNFTIFCNISRHLVRSLSVVKLPQNCKVSLLCKTQMPIISTFQTEPQKFSYNNNDEGSKYHRRYFDECRGAGIGLTAAFLSFFHQKEKGKEDTAEEKLVTLIKRSIICIDREEFDKAEQMLHLALRVAQETQNKDGITYVYDVMANLAMEREQFKKAEKLFANVMKRLFADGYSDDSPQVLHISSKLAHMAQLQGELGKSLQGFQWTLSKISQHLRKMPADKDVQELNGLTKNWYGQLLLKLGKYYEAKQCFVQAYDCLVEIYGIINQEAVTILNNLSVTCVHLEDFRQARLYLEQALNLSRELNDTVQEGILQANLGLVYLREGLIQQARENCSLAWRLGKKIKNHDAVEQAEYCLDEINSIGH